MLLNRRRLLCLSCILSSVKQSKPNVSSDLSLDYFQGKEPIKSHIRRYGQDIYQGELDSVYFMLCRMTNILMDLVRCTSQMGLCTLGTSIREKLKDKERL